MPYENAAPMYWEPGAPDRPIRGLFDVVDVVDGGSQRSILGVEYLTDVCTPAKTWDEWCVTNGAVKEASDLSLVEGSNFVVYAALTCPLGMSQDEQERRLRDTFDMKAEVQVEKAVWATLTSAPSDADADMIFKIVSALEQSLAENYAGRGLLHMGRGGAVLAGAEGAFQPATSDTAPIQTVNGTRVVMGRGYGNGQMVAASGQVSVLRGPLHVYRTTQTTTTGAMVLAEQAYTVLVECLAGWGEVAVA